MNSLWSFLGYTVPANPTKVVCKPTQKLKTVSIFEEDFSVTFKTPDGRVLCTREYSRDLLSSFFTIFEQLSDMNSTATSATLSCISPVDFEKLYCACEKLVAEGTLEPVAWASYAPKDQQRMKRVMKKMGCKFDASPNKIHSNNNSVDEVIFETYDTTAFAFANANRDFFGLNAIKKACAKDDVDFVKDAIESFEKVKVTNEQNGASEILSQQEFYGVYLFISQKEKAKKCIKFLTELVLQTEWLIIS